MMRAVFALVLSATAAACATGPALDQAVSVHNVFRQVVLDGDAAYAPIYASAQHAADVEFPNDQASYAKAMQVYDSVLNALVDAKIAEGVMRTALEQWQASADKRGVLDTTYACAADAVDKLSLALGQLPQGTPFYAAAFAVGAQLRALSDGSACPVSK